MLSSLSSVARRPRALPGDYHVGDTVFYAASNEKLSNGDRLLYGEEGEIVGPATSESHKDNGVAVKFSANTGVVDCYHHSAQSHTSPDDASGRLSRRRHRLLRGAERDVSNGDRVLYGEEGEIVGPATSETHKDNRVAVKFSANAGAVSCYITQLSRTPPPTTLPGGYRVGDTVFYAAPNETFPSGNRVLYGEEGEIVGPATSETHKDNGVAVKFSANTGAVSCYITQLSRTPPPTTLPGGYHVGDTVFYAAPNETFPSGDRLLYGEEGEIVGPATSETHKDNGVAVKFSANTCAVNCYLTQLGRTPPPTTLPGGYRVGDTVFYAAPNQTFSSGNRLLYGEEGEIVGPATSETHKDNGVAVKFSANTRAVSCYLTQLSRTPPPTTLPGGYRVGDTVFYAAPNETFPSGDRVLYGEEGEIVGPATSETHKDNGVAVKFSANTGAVNCYLTQLSRTPPPTTLPGGYRVGDTVFYAAPNRDVLKRRPAAVRRRRRDRRPGNLETHKDNGVAVKFSANAGAVSCYLTQLCRSPPPTALPGDHHVDDVVFNAPPPASIAETEVDTAAREQAFRRATELAEKAASELLASETVETDMKNARGASKKQKKKKKKNQNRQNRATSEPTRAESTGGELSDIEAKPRAAEAVAAHESAEPELKPAAAPSLSPAIIPATPPAPPTPAVASASPSSPPPRAAARRSSLVCLFRSLSDPQIRRSLRRASNPSTTRMPLRPRQTSARTTTAAEWMTVDNGDGWRDRWRRGR